MKISELVIACFKVEEMLAFYQNVFNIPFESVKIPQGSIYSGFIDDIQITLCAANIANIKAKDNRHQLTFTLDDIEDAIKKTEMQNGTILQNIQETDTSLQASIRDVDGNSIVLKQNLK